MHSTALPSGTVTFLFTDVEGSTRRWEADADAMRTAITAHDAVLRTAIEAHGGFLFSHTGDGVVAAFASPMSAIVAAIDAQRELELPVRIGIATGEAELRDGDYFGPVLNRAARVMAAGHGGQILVAESTAVLLSGVDLVDLGPRRLRDLPNPVGVFQVKAPGLRAEFPPLRAVDSSPGNLRLAASSFIGRESELDEVQAAVRAFRLVTLTGVGGVGKTRLAIEVASRLTNEFSDGVWVFELAAVADPAAVPDAVAAVLGVTQQPGMTVSESVAAALEGRVRLLVFDNCEHVRDAAADLIDAIFAQSATVRVLATSREGLCVADEQLWTVPSLDVDAGTESAAVTLFVERARRVAQLFSLVEPDQVAAVVDICRRLDGIPLAIELAASRMASMTPVEVRDRLDDRFRLLVASRRGLARHQTLRQAVAWSYDHLDDAERRLLERCSVFAGGFDLESACAVGGSAGCDEYAILDLLDALVRKSLLVADQSARRTRFSMLETIRRFTEDQLITHGEATEARDAHAHHFAQRATAMSTVWDSPRQREAYDWFSAELANLRNAFRWAADYGDLDTAAPIAIYAAMLGCLVESFEPVAWAEELVEPARAVDHPQLAALYSMASMCWMVGRVEEALGYCNAGQFIFFAGRGSVDLLFECWLGTTYMQIGHTDRSIDWFRKLLARGHDPLAMSRSDLVLALVRAGSHVEAMAVATDVVDAANATENPWALAIALVAYGMAFCDADPERARQALRRGLEIAEDSGNRNNASHLALVLGRLEAQYGDPLIALDHLTRAIRNYHDSGNTTLIHIPLAELAALLDRLKRYEPAATIAGFASNSLTRGWTPEIRTAVTHLAEVLGDQAYASLARKGETMTTAAMATYAYDQIDEIRTELKAIST